MYNELSIKIGSKNNKAFLQDGFYSATAQTLAMHKHNYAEIHVFNCNTVEYMIEDVIHSTSDGNLFIIPRNSFHCMKDGVKDALHVAFQIDLDVQSFASCHIDPQIVNNFINEVEGCKKTGDHATVSAYVSLFCSYLCTEKLDVEPIIDHSFLIYEFLSKHYHEDIHLSDLASVLHLSQRQTERLVIKSTGNTFMNELTAIRMNVAAHLLKTTDMSLEQISEYIGYRSYSGFWKAMKKHNLLNRDKEN